MKFRDFKIIIDGTLDNDEDAEAIKSMFGNKAKIEQPKAENTPPEEIQTIVYSVGKDNGYKENLRYWFK